MERKQFLLAVKKKMLEKGPLQSSLVTGLSLLDPRQMCSRLLNSIESLKRVLDSLIRAKKVTNSKGHRKRIQRFCRCTGVS